MSAVIAATLIVSIFSACESNLSESGRELFGGEAESSEEDPEADTYSYRVAAVTKAENGSLTLEFYRALSDETTDYEEIDLSNYELTGEGEELTPKEGVKVKRYVGFNWAGCSVGDISAGDVITLVTNRSSGEVDEIIIDNY